MSKSLLANSIRSYVDGLLDGDDEIVHRDAARDFIAANPGMVDAHLTQLVEREITAMLKERSQPPAPPMGQGVLFRGLPAAITVRDGVTKPLRKCTRDDLLAGRNFKVGNIEAAREALRRYDDDLDTLLPLLTDDVSTVADAIARLRGAA